MAEGIIMGRMDKDLIDHSILAKGEVDNASHGIILLNQWAVPHFDWATTIKIGAVKVSKTTAEYLIGRLKELLPDEKQEVMMIWLNYGWSVQDGMPDWKCRIDFSKIVYETQT
jgi:hypothetical protein